MSPRDWPRITGGAVIVNITRSADIWFARPPRH